MELNVLSLFWIQDQIQKKNIELEEEEKINSDLLRGNDRCRNPVYWCCTRPIAQPTLCNEVIPTDTPSDWLEILRRGCDWVTL